MDTGHKDNEVMDEIDSIIREEPEIDPETVLSEPNSDEEEAFFETEEPSEKAVSEKTEPSDKSKVDNSEISESSKEAEKLKKELAKDEKSFKNLQRFLIYLTAFLVILWVMFFKIIGITHMPSEDMEPRIDAGDLVLFYRLARKPQFQDVIVFEKVVDGKKTLMVGRVMAVPGDTVEISAGNSVIVNGNVLVEPKIYSMTPKREDKVTYPLTLGEKQYFVLVDNRLQGMDSRYFGPVTKDEILGTIITIIRRIKF